MLKLPKDHNWEITILKTVPFEVRCKKCRCYAKRKLGTYMWYRLDNGKIHDCKHNLMDEALR